MAFFDNLLSDEHLATRRSAQTFAEREIQPYAQEWEENEIFPIELYGKAGAAGLLGPGIHEDVGGSGSDPLQMVMAVEGLMRGGSTGVVVGLGTAGIACPPIIIHKDPYQIDTYVRPCMAGQQVAALAITEPNTGSDVAGVTTKAVRDGDHYVVNGAKIFISSGTRADFLTTLVRTGEEAHAGLTFLIIDAKTPGVTVSRALKKTGWCSSDTAELAFDNVRVPLKNRVGPEGSGFVTLMQNFQTERLALAAYGTATARMAYEETRRYVRERQAFGKPLSGFQVTRHKLADMITQIQVAETFVYQVATRMARKEEVIAEVSMAKNFAATLAQQVCYEAVQLHGAMGYMRETLVERLSRDARLLPIGGGTQEIMKEIISKRLAF